MLFDLALSLLLRVQPDTPFVPVIQPLREQRSLERHDNPANVGSLDEMQFLYFL